MDDYLKGKTLSKVFGHPVAPEQLTFILQVYGILFGRFNTLLQKHIPSFEYMRLAVETTVKHIRPKSPYVQLG